MVRSFERGGLTRRQFVCRMLALGLSVSAIGTALAACGEEETAAEAPSIEPTVTSDTLSFYTWAEYINPEVKKEFTKRTGIRVVETNFMDNESLVTKMMALQGSGDYDVIVPGDYAADMLRKSSLLEPLDMRHISNFEHVSEVFRKPAFDPEDDDLKYTVPYQWGSLGIGVRTDKIREPITKWEDLWNPEYKKMISMQDSSRMTMSSGMFVAGFDQNSTNPDEIDAGGERLIEQKPLVGVYDSVTPWRHLKSADMPLVHCWNGEVVQAIDYGGADPDTLEFVHPEDGYVLFIDNLCIPKGSKNMYAAHLFLNHILDPEMELLNSNWIGFLPPQQEPMEQLDPMVIRYAPSEETAARGTVTTDVGEATRLYDEAWKRVKAA